MDVVSTVQGSVAVVSDIDLLPYHPSHHCTFIHPAGILQALLSASPVLDAQATRRHPSWGLALTLLLAHPGVQSQRAGSVGPKDGWAGVDGFPKILPSYWAEGAPLSERIPGDPRLKGGRGSQAGPDSLSW